MVWPLNWMVYVHGLKWIIRDHARENIRRHKIASYSFTGGKKVDEWLAEQSILGE